MDVIELIKKDKAYLKCKRTVKNWEKEFKTKHARTPSKFDIKEAPAMIKFAYKKYFQLKSSALETSLCVSDFDDNLDSFDPSHPLSDHAVNELSPDPIIETLPSSEQLEELLKGAKIKETKTNSNPDIIVKPYSQFTNTLSKKLFENRRFSMRNPRKHSLHKSQSSLESLDNSLVSQEVLEEELDTINKTQSMECMMFDGLPKSTVNSDAQQIIQNIGTVVDVPKVREINKGWLQRTTGLDVSNNSKDDVNESFGMRNIQIAAIEPPSDFIENSEPESDDSSSIDKLKPALKKRKYSSVLKQGSKTEEVNNLDYNCINKDIKEVPQKRIKAIKKTSSKIEVPTSTEQPPDISVFLPFGLDIDITPRHANVGNALKEINVANDMDKSKRAQIDGKGRLENKIKSGTLNENFVKINIEKKVFVRGKKTTNYSKYKKQQWKDKKALNSAMEFPESGKISCFKCGNHGHMARYCTAHRGDSLLPLDDQDDDNTLTLEEMAKIALSDSNKTQKTNEEELVNSLNTPEMVPESFMKLLASTSSTPNHLEVKPIYSDCEENSNLGEVLKLFGHNSFRPGQKKAIMRVLCGMSTLIVLPTGGGKSLCYQIPAYIYSQNYKCITLVISPLVSLMEDQVLSMPEFLKAGCLHTNQPPAQRQKIIKLIKDGELNILLISPEALIAGDSSNGIAGLFKSLPPIAFACIDEAHCVSQWSHNFRPSYLMLCRVLREKLKVNCILGLTATATQSTIKSVISHIRIPDGLSGVITNPAVPDNLMLSVSYEKEKDRALVSLLSNGIMNSYNSIIVYCIRRDECERVAAILRSSLQEPGKINMEKQTKKRKRMSYIAEAYHAGMSAAQRRKIQNHFMDGSLRIIVATVAFGMGINKSDIRSIIHYNMPSNFESYVQEIGRAGRDGKPAHCHAFLTNSNNDKNELLKHIHSNTLERHTIRKLLKKVFIPCDCRRNCLETINEVQEKKCKGHEIGIPIDQTVEELDLPSENISTLLCYLELHPKNYIKVLNNAYIMCKIIAYGGPQKILEAAKRCRPLAMAYVMKSKKNEDITKSSILEFNVIEVSSAIGWDSGMVKYHLKNLEWISESGTSRRSHLKVEFNTLGFKIKASGDLSATELDQMLDDMHECVLTQEKAMLYQLEEIHLAFTKLGNSSIENNEDIDSLAKKSSDLKKYVRGYFHREEIFNHEIVLEDRPLEEERVKSDVRALVSSYKDCSFTGRSIAKIFQGISSPNFPAIVWGRCKFWRAHIHEDFNGLIRLATQELLQMKLI